MVCAICRILMSLMQEILVIQPQLTNTLEETERVEFEFKTERTMERTQQIFSNHRATELFYFQRSELPVFVSLILSSCCL